MGVNEIASGANLTGNHASPIVPRFSLSMNLGEGRLEVCGNGPGPAVPVDLLVRRVRGHGRYHPAGTDAVR